MIPGCMIRFACLGHAAACLLIITLWTAGLAAGSLYPDQMLPKLVAEAMENNMALQSRTARIRAMESRATAAGALPDPRIGLAVQSLPTDTFDFNQEPMTQKQIFVEQSVPWLSKLTLKTKSVQKEAAEKKAELKAAKLKLAKGVAVAWYELGYVAESQRINEELKELMERIRRDAQSRYAVGRGLQQDIFQAEVETSRLQDQAMALAEARRTIEDRLHEMLNRETFRPIEPPQDLPEPEIDIATESLAETAFERNPELRSLDAAVARSRIETSLAEKNSYPDFNIRLTYGQRDEDRTGRDLPDFFSAAVMFNIPLWHKNKQTREMAAAMENRNAAQNLHQDLKNRLPHQIRALVSEIGQTQKRYRLYTDELIARANQWARSAVDAYQVGQVEFDTMINARIRVLKYKQEAARLFYTIYQKKAELAALIGNLPTSE